MNTKQQFTKKKSIIVDQILEVIPVSWVPNKAVTEHNQQQNLSANTGVLSSKKETITRDIVNMVNSAQSSVIACSFLLADEFVEDALFSASSRGIRVYLMLASETQLNNDSNDEFSKKCLKQHKQMLKRLGGNVFICSAPHFHAKVVLVDALFNNPGTSRGILLTANLTSEALQRNEELGIKLSHSEIEETVKVLKWAFFEDAEHQMLDDTHFTARDSLDAVDHPEILDKVVFTSSKSRSIQNEALRLINKAENELIVSSFGWQEDHEVVESIIQKAKSGVKVIVLARIRDPNMNALIKLKSAGAEVFGFKWLHAKAIWIDSDEAMVMSANLQNCGLDEGFEIGLKINGNRSLAVKDCLISFLSETHSRLTIDEYLGDLNGQIKVWYDNKFQYWNVKERETVPLPDVKAQCLTNMEFEADIPQVKPIKYPAHEVEFVWEIIPPELPDGVKELFKEEKVNEVSRKKQKNFHKKEESVNKLSYEPKVYQDKNKQHFISISKESDIELAQKLRDQFFKNAKLVLSKKIEIKN